MAVIRPEKAAKVAEIKELPSALFWLIFAV